MIENKVEDWQRLVVSFRQCFPGEAGQKVLNYLSYQCYENRNTFDDENKSKGDRNLGKREIILLIREWMAKDPNEIPKQLRIIDNA